MFLCLSTGKKSEGRHKDSRKRRLLRKLKKSKYRCSPIANCTNFSAELLQTKMDLVRNLEEFLEKHDFEKKHQRREEVQQEEKRLAFLRRDRVSLEFTNNFELLNLGGI
jgi:hypothetical protein